MSTPNASSCGIILDVDGTLVDSNYLHIVAWWQAFRAAGHDVAMSDLHALVGQGADQLVSAVLGDPDDAVHRAHSRFYAPYLGQLRRFPRADELVRAIDALGLVVVLATSAAPEEVEALLETLDADDAVTCVTGSADVERAKPAPDLVEAALSKAGLSAENCLMVGDTAWDVTAAGEAGVRCTGVLSGGVDASRLRAAGAVEVYRDVAALLDALTDSPIGELARR